MHLLDRSRFLLAALTATAVALTLPTGSAGASEPPRDGTVVAPLLGSATDTVVPDRYVVVLRDGVAPAGDSAAAIDRARDAGVRPTAEYRHALHGYAAALDAGQLAEVRRDPDVAYVALDTVVELSDDQTPATWGIDRVDQGNLPLDDHYQWTVDGTGVTAYVIDSGIRPTHTDMAGRVSAGHTVIQDGLGTDDCNGHGTHVAGTIGGTTYGVAKGVTLVPVRVFDCSGSGTVADIVLGVDWVTATHTANPTPSVANLSLESYGAGTLPLTTAVEGMIAAGVTSVAAAGNQQVDACTSSPANVTAALTVGATNDTDTPWPSTNTGTCIDLEAPGQDVESAGIASDTEITTKSGTSMAAPHVAGIAALYLEEHPTKTPAQIGATITGWASPGVLTGLAPGSPNLLAYAPPQWESKIISLAPGGGAANAGSYYLSPSENAAYLAFQSSATNLVTGDSNGFDDIFVHEQATGTTTLASRTPSGGPANGASYQPVLSDNGRYVAFYGNASNLGATDANAAADVYVFDRQTGKTKLVSATGAGIAGNGPSRWPAISGNGRYVVFSSDASNLVSGDTNGRSDVFRRDLKKGKTIMVSRTASGGLGNNHSLNASIDRKGRYVTYHSAATNIVGGDTNNSRDSFLYDTKKKKVTLISKGTGGGVANADSNFPTISADGTSVTYYSYASDLVAGDTFGWDVFVWDLKGKTSTMVSRAAGGGAANGFSYEPAISADGQMITYFSAATNLVAGDAGDSGNGWDVFTYDRRTGVTRMVSRGLDGAAATLDSVYPQISADGRYVTYWSYSDNLAPGDGYAGPDVFLARVG